MASLITYAQVIERDMFQKRMKEGKDLYLNELFYPLIQGYDSVIMDVDLEVGGSDQTFNMLMGRTLMKKISGKEKFVLTTKLLVDKEGNKVGKTSGNALFLNSTPEKFFGGIMSFPDEVLESSFELLTEVPLEGIKEKIAADPMGEKKRLAFEIIKLLWDEKAATSAREEFEKVFQKREEPEKIVEVEVKKTHWELKKFLFETGLAKSNSEAKRLIEHGAVDVDGQTITDPQALITFNTGTTIKIGKTKFLKVSLS